MQIDTNIINATRGVMNVNCQKALRLVRVAYCSTHAGEFELAPVGKVSSGPEEARHKKTRRCYVVMKSILVNFKRKKLPCTALGNITLKENTHNCKIQYKKEDVHLYVCYVCV